MARMPEGAPAAPSDPSDLPVELRILEMFEATGKLVIGPTDAQRYTGVSKGTLSRKLKALADGGYLAPAGDGGGKYQLGPRLAMAWLAYSGAIVRQLERAAEHASDLVTKARAVGYQAAAAYRKAGDA